MTSITYGGLKYAQVRHAIYCKTCKTTVESKFITDFKMCSCNSVGVDGGTDRGNRIIGSHALWEPRMMYVAVINKKKFWLPESAIVNHFSKTLVGREAHASFAVF